MVLQFILAALLTASLQSRVPIDIISIDQHPEQIVWGSAYACGPLWIKSQGLLFSDPGQDAVFTFANGKANRIIHPSSKEFGHALDASGQVSFCQQGGRVVGKRSKDSKLKVLASMFDGKRLNGPVDLAIKSDGSIYFTDPKTVDPRTKLEMGFSGVYRIKPDGTIDLLSKELAFPNGIAFSKDEKKLFVSDTIRMCMNVFDVLPDGSITNCQVFSYLMGDNAGAPGGIRLDVKGNVYAAGPGGVLVFDSVGKYKGLIFVKDAVTSLCFGGSDYQTLFITAAHGVYRIKVKVPGLHLDFSPDAKH